jgi:hypothetical protein
LQKAKLIAALAGTGEKPYWVVDEQTTGDIMRCIMVRHEMCTADYDKIASYFNHGDIKNICANLWDFCRDNFTYKEEDGETQKNSRPITMLQDGKVDCKNYSLFIGGVLDALQRQGLKFHWCYRFASYDVLDTRPKHVFVVVNRNTDNIWVDPVVEMFNYHLFYWHHKDKRPAAQGATVGRIPIGLPEGLTIGSVPRARVGASAEATLLAQLAEYTNGLVQAVQVTQQTSTINTITSGVLTGIVTGVSVAVPLVGAALAALKLIDVGLGDVFGQGSAAALVLGDITSFNLTGLVNNLFNGRTYNTDQYWGVALYQNKVLGKGSINNQDQINDSQVIAGLKWFIDRTGVFISGREHIIALTQSPAAYMALSSVNSDTTTDPVRVQAAYLVAKKYWSDPTNYSSSEAGSWADTIGVFDLGLAQIAAQNGETAEQLAAATSDAYAYTETDTVNPATATTDTTIIPGVSNILLYAAFGLIAVIGLTD